MSPEEITNLTVEDALTLLKEYSCIEIKTVDSLAEKQKLREALILITSLSEYTNIGVCADNPEIAFETLSSYLKVFGYNYETIQSATIPDGFDGVYIKYNSKKMSYYLDSYSGNHRGVLVSCQGEDEARIIGTYGHFPLDLFLN